MVAREKALDLRLSLGLLVQRLGASGVRGFGGYRAGNVGFVQPGISSGWHRELRLHFQAFARVL